MQQLKQIGSDQCLALTKIFNRRWWWTTLLVLVGMAFLAGLGLWQLDRLEQRRAQNTYELTQWHQDPFAVHTEPLPADLNMLDNRQIVAEGRFDYDNQQIWQYQTFFQQIGVKLVTPLVFEDPGTQQEKGLLVVRGWVPTDSEENWQQYDEDIMASIFGRAFKSQLLLSGELPTEPDAANRNWSYINVELIQPTVDYELLPFILVQLPEKGRTYGDLPIREIWVPAASEGNHLSYAIQWFSFAIIFGFGYLQFILWQERREKRIRAHNEANPMVPRGADVETPQEPQHI